MYIENVERKVYSTIHVKEIRCSAQEKECLKKAKEILGSMLTNYEELVGVDSGNSDVLDFGDEELDLLVDLDIALKDIEKETGKLYMDLD